MLGFEPAKIVNWLGISNLILAVLAMQFKTTRSRREKTGASKDAGKDHTILHI